MRATELRAKIALATFASALGLLLLNDWLLKGQGWVPGWLTGKLSDLTGLIVAPVCLASLLSARRRSAQLCCVALVAGVFALTELSPACTEALERTLAALGLGLGWRLWPDPSDLLALVILPVSWLCCRELVGPGAPGSAGRRLRWLTLPACLACLASGGTDTFSSRAYLYNATSATALVEVSSAWLGCDALEAFDPAFLEPADFAALGVFELPAGAVLPLEPGDLGDEDEARTRGDCMCPLLRIASGGRTVNVLLRELPRVRLVKQPSGSERRRHRGQLVSLQAGAQPFEVGDELTTFELALPGTSTSQVACPAAPPAALDASLPPADAIVRNGAEAYATLLAQRILAVTPVTSSCFELSLAAASDAGQPPASDAGADAAAELGGPSPPLAPRLQLCAPLALFPFQAGDVVQLEWVHLNPGQLTRESLDLRNEAAGFRLERGMYFGASYRSQWRNYEASLRAQRCGPLRDAEGEPFEPVDVAYAGQPLVPGEAVQIEAAGDVEYFSRARERFIYLGRAERQLTRACGTDELWIEAVETWTN